MVYVLEIPVVDEKEIRKIKNSYQVFNLFVSDRNIGIKTLLLISDVPLEQKDIEHLLSDDYE